MIEADRTFALAALSIALLACGTLRSPPPGADGRDVVIDRQERPMPVSKVREGATRAGCTVQPNGPDGFSASCPKAGSSAGPIVIACVKVGTTMTRGCAKGTDPASCRLVWDAVFAQMEPAPPKQGAVDPAGGP